MELAGIRTVTTSSIFRMDLEKAQIALVHFIIPSLLPIHLNMIKTQCFLLIVFLTLIRILEMICS
jgi:hypothetical protein